MAVTCFFPPMLLLLLLWLLCEDAAVHVCARVHGVP
jgi:hypothetical protein